MRHPIEGWSKTLRFGSLLQRTICHYWYHTGENQAIRKLLGYADLPDFMGDIDNEASYRPEQDSHSTSRAAACRKTMSS